MASEAQQITDFPFTFLTENNMLAILNFLISSLAYLKDLY